MKPQVIDYACIPTDLSKRKDWPSFVRSMFASIQTEPFKQLLYLWPEKAIRILYNNYYDALTYVAQRHTSDVHAAEEIVQYTLAELWLRHKEGRLDHSQSVQHYLVATVKRRARKALERKIAWNRQNGIMTEIKIEEAHDDDDVRLIIENPPEPYDKFGFDQSTYYYWRRVEYIFYPWMKYRGMFFRGLRNFFIGSVVAVFFGCVYYLLAD